MTCKIERLVSHNEEAWIIKLTTKVVPDFVVLFAALHLEIIETIQLVDKASDCTIKIYHQGTKKNKAEYKIGLNKEEYPISRINLEAITALMTRVAMNGWFDAAHIDIEINEYTSLCFAIESPFNEEA